MIDNLKMINCIGDVDFSNAEIANFEATNSDLTDSDFSGANIPMSAFIDSDLTGTSFRNANLTHCQFKNVDLSDSTMEDAKNICVMGQRPQFIDCLILPWTDRGIYQLAGDRELQRYQAKLREMRERRAIEHVQESKEAHLFCSDMRELDLSELN
jgi:uncharacterized protein YjbI with pentapeptide repeats